jgi:hydrogenase maturation protease
LTTLVLGIGNLLLGDEGVGIHAVRELERKAEHLKGVEILEVGTAILDALPALEKAERVILLDAMQAQGEPGSVYRVPLSRCSGSQQIASMHGFDIFRVLTLAERKEPPEVIVLGVEPAHMGWSMELSPPVTKGLQALLDAVFQEVAGDIL